MKLFHAQPLLVPGKSNIPQFLLLLQLLAQLLLCVWPFLSRLRGQGPLLCTHETYFGQFPLLTPSSLPH